jgi:hypothetical protein
MHRETFIAKLTDVQQTAEQLLGGLHLKSGFARKCAE